MYDLLVGTKRLGVKPKSYSPQILNFEQNQHNIQQVDPKLDL